MTDANRRLAYVALWLAWSVAMGWGAYQWLHFGELTAEQRVKVEALRACQAMNADDAHRCWERER